VLKALKQRYFVFLLYMSSLVHCLGHYLLTLLVKEYSKVYLSLETLLQPTKHFEATMADDTDEQIIANWISIILSHVHDIKGRTVAQARK
jgi:hypothetical protein